MNVLVSAFACAPTNVGAERGVGLLAVNALSKHHDVWVLTDAENRENLGSNAFRHSERIRVIYIDPGYHIRKLRGVYHLYYVLWQVLAYREARQLTRQVSFDLVFHVTYANSWLPSCLMGFLKVPFLWYAGGRGTCPPAFLHEMSTSGAAREIVRNVCIRSLGPVVNRLTAQRADRILSPTPPEEWSVSTQIERFTIGGLTQADIQALNTSPAPSRGPFRVASVGRLLSVKAFGLTIKAFQRLRSTHPESELWIIGDGPERDHLKSVARNRGCHDHVYFFGWLSRPDTLQRVKEIDVLVHPSLHELFGYAMLEAMAAGKPVICLDKEGAPITVGDGGAVVPARSPDQVVEDIGRTLIRLAGDPAIYRQLSMKARTQAQEWMEETIGARIVEQCEQVAAQTSTASSDRSA